MFDLSLLCDFIEMSRLKKYKGRLRGEISVNEFKSAVDEIIKVVQNAYCRAETSSLRNNQPLNTKSHISSLNPFLDDTRILRVGDRLKFPSNIRYSR